jgi:hypothetical protein
MAANGEFFSSLLEQNPISFDRNHNLVMPAQAGIQ